MNQRARRILLTARSGQFAGVERRMLQEAQALISMGHEVRIAHSSFLGEDRLIAGARTLGVEIFRLDLPPFLRDWRLRHIHYAKYKLMAQQLTFVKGYDLVHVFMPWANAGLEHAFWAGNAGVDFVLSAHNAFPRVSATPWHRRFLSRAFRHCAGVYGVSNSALQLFETGLSSYLPQSTVRRVVYNYVDTRVFVPRAEDRSRFRETLGVRSDTLLVGCVGRLSDHKRPLYTLDVFARVAKQHPSAHFVFVGEGDLCEDLRAQIRATGLENRVHVLPFTNRPEEIFPALDVHVLLSKVEGFGISTAEALSCGVPVVATAVPGSEEVLKHGETGFLVGKDDAGAAIESILNLLNDDQLRKRFGKTGRQDCEKRFARAVWEKKIKEFYATVLDGTSDITRKHELKKSDPPRPIV